jgi:hypothetical protein
VLPILVGGGVSTAGVILTVGAMAGAVMLPEAVIPVALGAGILGTSMAVGGSLSIFVGTGIGVARAVACIIFIVRKNFLRLAEWLKALIEYHKGSDEHSG